MTDHRVVSQEQWRRERIKLLREERALAHRRDLVNAARTALPWVRVEKEYRFGTPQGQKSLGELFDGRSQLLVYHFMLGPDWKQGCDGCSFLSDHFEGTLPHLNHHDVTLTAVSRAPLDNIEAYRKRMGWNFPWASSAGSDFNFDYHVSFSPEEIATGSIDYNYEPNPVGPDHGDEAPGMSAFFKDADGTIFHTYSAYARGIEEWIGTLMILDRAPKGRNEQGTMSFVKRHDEYEGGTNGQTCH